LSTDFIDEDVVVFMVVVYGLGEILMKVPAVQILPQLRTSEA